MILYLWTKKSFGNLIENKLAWKIILLKKKKKQTKTNKNKNHEKVLWAPFPCQYKPTVQGEVDDR